jgi:hypothetical protein
MTVLPPPEQHPNDPMTPIDPESPENPTDPREPLEPMASKAAEGDQDAEKADPDAVREHYREMTSLGADIRGEGQIVPD